jgi:hypothetical protein
VLRSFFHGGNTGSNPVGDANLINHLQIPRESAREKLPMGYRERRTGCP